MNETVVATLEPGARPPPKRMIRFPRAEVRSRRVFMSGAGSDRKSGPRVITKQTAPSDPIPCDDASSQPALKRKRVAVNEDSSGPVINTVNTDSEDSSATLAQQPKGPPSPSPSNP